MFSKKTFQILVCIALVLAAVGLFTPRDPGDPLTPFAYQTNFYITDGGDKAVAADGGEIEMLSGSTLDVQDGATAAIYDLTVNDTLNVDGDIDLDGDGFDVNITAGFSIDADAGSNISLSSGDMLVDAEAGSVTIIGSEADASAIHLDANDTVTSGINVDVGSVSGLAIDGGLTDFGTGTYATADGDGDVGIEGDLEINTGLDLDGTTFDVDITGEVSIDADLASNFSAAAGDITIDAEAGSVNIIGSEAANNSVYIDANDTVTSGIDIDTGTVSGLRIDGGPLSIDGTGAFNINTAASDITVEAETGSVTIKGDEGAGDAIHLDADQTALGGVTIAANTGGVDTNLTATGPFAIDGDMLIVGNDGADGDVAVGDNDALVVGVLEVDGELELDGTLDADSTSNFSDTATFSRGAGDAIDISAGGALNNDGTLDQNGTSDFGANVTVSAGDFDVTLGSTTVETFTVGANAAGNDAYFYGDTSGKYALWDTGGDRLVIIGVDSTTGFDLQDGDALINDDLTVTTGGLTVSAGPFDVTLGSTTVETMTVGANAAGNDVIFYAVDTGDLWQWNASAASVTITGGDGNTAFDVADGNAIVNDDLTVTAGAFDVTAGATTVETMTVGVSATGADVIFHSDTGGEQLTWDTSAHQLVLDGINASTVLDVTDGNVDFADELDVTGTTNLDVLDVDGAADFDSTVSISDTLDMTDDIITNIGASGTDFGADGSLTLAKGLTISAGDAVVADDLRVTAQTAITVTDAGGFSATGTYQAITAAGEVTPTINAGTAGDLLVLINTSAQTINIADTGIQMLSAAWAAGQYDVLVLWCDGTNWIEISRSNN